MKNEKSFEHKFEMRLHLRHSYRSAFGKSTCEIDCPFCGQTITAYIWSLSGSGKKCDCGALHGTTGYTIKKSKDA